MLTLHPSILPATPCTWLLQHFTGSGQLCDTPLGRRGCGSRPAHITRQSSTMARGPSRGQQDPQCQGQWFILRPGTASVCIPMGASAQRNLTTAAGIASSSI